MSEHKLVGCDIPFLLRDGNGFVVSCRCNEEAVFTLRAIADFLAERLQDDQRTCLVCDAVVLQRGFCSRACHDEFYDNLPGVEGNGGGEV